MAEKTNFVLKDNTGFIFKNKKKTEDKHPTYKGAINVEGKEYDVSLWVKTGQSGESYFSARIAEPYKKEGQPEPVNEADDLPF